MPLVRGLGATARVDLSQSELDEGQFRSLWERCLVVDEGSPAAVTVTATPGQSMEALTQQLTRALIRANRGRLLMVHAGAVADRTTGRALVFVAPGGTGKSTLASRLGRQFGYLGDETVGLDPVTWAVNPYPKPLTLVRPQEQTKREHAPDELGMLLAPAQAQLHGLVILRRHPTGAARFTPLGLLDAIALLVPQTSALRALPSPLQLLARLHGEVGCTLVDYSESDDPLAWCADQVGAS